MGRVQNLSKMITRLEENFLAAKENLEFGRTYDSEESISTSKVPIYCKMTLTIREAAEYSNIGINKIESMLKQPNCPFVLFVGTRKLVKRREFEEYIRGKLVI